MKNLFIGVVCLFLGVSCAFGQVSKTDKIYSAPFFGDLSAVEKYNAQDQLEYIQVIVTAVDQQYQHIQNYFTVYSGSPTEFVSFCDELLAFAENYDKGVHKEIQGITVSLEKQFGAQLITVYNKALGSSGYRQYTPKQIEKAKEKFLKWANKKSLALN